MMRRLAWMLCVLLLAFTAAAADVDFDPTRYTTEELREIRAIIDAALAEEPAPQVLYDQNGLYVEYRGLVPFELGGPSWYQLSLLVDNGTQDDVVFELEGCKANRAMVMVIGNAFSVPRDTVYLTGTMYDFVIDFSALTAYGIDRVTEMEMHLILRDAVRAEIPLVLTGLDYPVEK